MLARDFPATNLAQVVRALNSANKSLHAQKQAMKGINFHRTSSHEKKISANAVASQFVASSKKPKCMAACVVFGAMVVIGGLSGYSQHLNYSGATKSLEILGGEFMENVPLHLESSLQKRLDPLRLHMLSGLRLLHAQGADVTAWAGISQVRKFTASFLLSFFKENKCCFAIFANMGCGREEVAQSGGWQGWLEQHKDNYGSKSAIFDRVLLDADAEGHVTLTAWENKHRNGSLTNPTIATPLDVKTLQPLAPLSESKNYGFIPWPQVDGHNPDHNVSGWWQTVHHVDLQPGEFHFTPVFVWKDTAPFCLKVMGVVPLYENTAVPDDQELAMIKAGTLQWNAGRRVGAWVVGFKLWFLSAHLAAMNLKGGFLFYVDRSTGILVAASDTSVPELTDAEDYDKVKPIPAHQVSHQLIQEASKVLAPGGNWKAIAQQLNEVELQGKTQFVLTFAFPFYGLDFQGVYIVPRDVLLQDLDKSATDNALFGIIVNTVFAGVLLLVLFYWGRKTFSRFQQAAIEQDRSLRQRVAEGLNSVNEIGFPMVLTAAPVFMSMPLNVLQMCHESARDRGDLLFLDRMQKIKDFRQSGFRIVFFSYQWLSWIKSGPNEKQWQLMLKALQFTADELGVPLDRLYVWLDILSVPQDHDGIKVLAVNSLYVYATACDALVIIAPESRHEGTGAIANIDSYKERAWTRTEQTAHASVHGSSNMYIAEPDGLKAVSENWVRDVVSIFQGEMTCCRLKHKSSDRCDKEFLVTLLLGVWYKICLAQRGTDTHNSAELLHSIMSPEKSFYFPKTFEFVTENQTETRTLFGDMLACVERMAKEEINTWGDGEERMAKEDGDEEKSDLELHETLGVLEEIDI